MIFSKRATALCAFVVGATLLTTAAFADVILGSGYYSLKESTKTTMAKLTNEVENFSVDLLASVKVDGETFVELESKAKFDIANQAQETIQRNLENGETRETYWYSDQKQSINKNFEDDSYNVTDRQKYNKETRKVFENPFENAQIADAEKIVDAFVGSLQDIIQIEESGGKKMFMGNLSDTQIPPLVNAVSSFALKYSILDEREAKKLNVPYPKTNIYVIDASGKAIENENGILESIIVSARVSAEDSSGIKHIYSVELSIDVKDINNTIVTAPDLDGQEVIYSKEGIDFDSKYIGKYKNDIVKEEANSFVKYGERVIEITSVEQGIVKGKYYEVYNEGYEAETVKSFEFTTRDDETSPYKTIYYTDNNGEERIGILNQSGMQNINLSLDVVMEEDRYSYSNDDKDFDSDFKRIFE